MRLITTDLISAIAATSTATGYDIDDTTNKKPWTTWKANTTPATITADYSAAIAALFIGGIDAATIRVYLKNGSAVIRYDSGVITPAEVDLWVDESSSGWVFGAIKTDVVQAVIVLTHATAPSVATVFGGAMIETEGNNGLSFAYDDTSIKTQLYKPETAMNIVDGYQPNKLSFTTVCGYDTDGYPELISACRDAAPWPMPCKPWPDKSDYSLFGWCQSSGKTAGPDKAQCNFSIKESL